MPTPKAIKFGTFFQILVSGAGTIVDSSGNALDGNGDGTSTGTATDNFSRVMGRGKTLAYLDGDRDSVTLKLAGGGQLELVLAPNGEGQQLKLIGATGKSTLTGAIKQAKLGGDGKTTLQSIMGAAGVRNQLPVCDAGTPPKTKLCFNLPPSAISAVMVDSLLESDRPSTISILSE